MLNPTSSNKFSGLGPGATIKLLASVEHMIPEAIRYLFFIAHKDVGKLSKTYRIFATLYIDYQKRGEWSSAVDLIKNQTTGSSILRRPDEEIVNEFSLPPLVSLVEAYRCIDELLGLLEKENTQMISDAHRTTASLRTFSAHSHEEMYFPTKTLHAFSPVSEIPVLEDLNFGNPPTREFLDLFLSVSLNQGTWTGVGISDLRTLIEAKAPLATVDQLGRPLYVSVSFGDIGSYLRAVAKGWCMARDNGYILERVIGDGQGRVAVVEFTEKSMLLLTS